MTVERNLIERSGRARICKVSTEGAVPTAIYLVGNMKIKTNLINPGNIPNILFIESDGEKYPYYQLMMAKIIKEHLHKAKINRPNLKVIIYIPNKRLDALTYLFVTNIEEARIGELIKAEQHKVYFK